MWIREPLCSKRTVCSCRFTVAMAVNLLTNENSIGEAVQSMLKGLPECPYR
jgi:hypothetical protein